MLPVPARRPQRVRPARAAAAADDCHRDGPKVVTLYGRVPQCQCVTVWIRGGIGIFYGGEGEGKGEGGRGGEGAGEGEGEGEGEGSQHSEKLMVQRHRRE